MASGKPIVSSNRGPMPEVLEDGAYFFDPENIASIKFALEEVINNPEASNRKALKSLQRSEIYNWSSAQVILLNYSEG